MGVTKAIVDEGMGMSVEASSGGTEEGVVGVGVGRMHSGLVTLTVGKRNRKKCFMLYCLESSYDCAKPE